MIDFLRGQPLILLFLVAAIGYPLGLLRLGGSSLGVAAVLFVGLAFGALDPDLKLPEIVYQLGLVLFVYTIGLSSGPGFFRSLKRKGLRDNLFIAAMLLLAAALTLGLHAALGLRPAQAAGLFAGSMTNTPALASVLEYLNSAAPAARGDQLLADANRERPSEYRLRHRLSYRDDRQDHAGATRTGAAPVIRGGLYSGCCGMITHCGHPFSLGTPDADYTELGRA